MHPNDRLTLCIGCYYFVSAYVYVDSSMLRMWINHSPLNVQWSFASEMRERSLKFSRIRN